MMFLLRCAFWLGLTFSFMDWPDGAPPAPDAQALARQAAQMAAQEIAARCAASERSTRASSGSMMGIPSRIG